jgi:uncharacterized membrane protein
MRRTEAFSDAVFAIAMTLLILELKVPDLRKDAGNLAMVRALISQWPSYLALLTSFMSVLLCWVNHHGILNLVVKFDRRFKFLNGVLLLLVSVVPYPTKLLADFLTAPSGNVAAAIYSWHFLLLDLAYLMLWKNASRNRRLIEPDLPEQRIWGITRGLIIGLPAYGAALGVSLLNAYAGFGICIALWVYWALFHFFQKL